MVTKTKLYINGQDAETTWGLRLDGNPSGYDALLAPRSMKEPVTNKNVTAQGAVVVCGTGLYDERTLSVPCHIVAKGYLDFEAKKNALISTLETGSALAIEVKRYWKVPGTNRTTEETEMTASMYYMGMNQFTEFAIVQDKVYNNRTGSWSDVAGTGYGIAKFTLILYEPNG